MWLYNQGKDRIERGYPRQICTKWSGLPRTIDSMFEWRGRTYFVAYNKVYRVNQTNNGIDSGYPKQMFSGGGKDYLFLSTQNVGNWPPVHAVSEFDDGDIYIFRGWEVLRVDARKGEVQWPQLIHWAFRGTFPWRVDSVFYNRNDGYVYAFSRSYYYKCKAADKSCSFGGLIGRMKFKNLCPV